MTTIRITRELRLFPTMFGKESPLTIPEGFIFRDGEGGSPIEITSAGNALVGIAYDDPIVLPVGSFVVEDDHRSMLVVNNGKNHVECRCGLRVESTILADDGPIELSIDQLRDLGRNHVEASR